METSLMLDDAVGHTRTGDLWLFRGRSAADRAIQVATNAPVNHVGMAVVLDDLPPLMWHAELGRSLEDMWTGTHQRGVQLHDLYEAVRTWHDKYGQQAWLRQLDAEITPEMEHAVLRTIARLDGTAFPNTARLASRWVRGRVHNRASLETLFCAEVVASTYAEMDLIAEQRPENWYDPGSFWSGDALALRHGATLSPEVRVHVPPLPGDEKGADVGGGEGGDEAGARRRREAARAWWRQNAERVRADRLADPLRVASESVRAAAGPVRAAGGPLRSAAGPVRAAAGPVRAAPGALRSVADRAQATAQKASQRATKEAQAVQSDLAQDEGDQRDPS